MNHDLLIENARIIDGTGAPWYEGHLAINDGRIAEIYRGEHGTSADVRVDVDGNMVSPGFIDTHSHSDLRMFSDPTLEPKIRQGITTEILGQDGFSMAPMHYEGGADLWEDHLSGLDGRKPGEWDWGTTTEYFNAIESNGVAPNVGMLVGHGTVRFNVLGMSDAEPTDAELTEMCTLVKESLEEGALGLSTGLIYTPQCNATTEEVRTLGAELTSYKRPYVAHIRSERFRIWEAMDEFVDIGVEENIPLHHSHFKVVGEPQHGRAARANELIEYARDRGVDYVADQYPYTAGSTMLGAVLPPWVKTGDPSETVDRLTDPEARERIRRDVEQSRLDDWHNPGKYTGWENIVIASVEAASGEEHVGKSIAEIADETDQPPIDVVCDLLIESKLDVTMTLHQLEENDVREILQNERVCVGTDGIFGGGKPHPRLYGSYPRILEKYVREENLITMEEAIRKMTSLPARVFGLHHKGIVRPEMDADLVVFDPRTVSTEATYGTPRRFPTGIPHVLVNGEFVVRDGEPTGALPGSVVRA